MKNFTRHPTYPDTTLDVPSFDQYDVFKYTKEEHLETTLENRTLPWGWLKQYNDIFECSFQLSYYQGIESPEARLAGGGMDRASRIVRHVHAYLNQVRATCFSDVPDIEAMWALYAEQHRGVALGFNHTEMYPMLVLGRGPVAYSTRIPELDVFEPTNSSYLETVARRVILTKPDHWAHEREYRLFTTEDPGSYIPPFEPASLKCVILGNRMSGKAINAAKARVAAYENRHGVEVSVMYAQPSCQSYEMLIRNQPGKS